MGSHLFIEHVTTSEVECTEIVLMVGGEGGGNVYIIQCMFEASIHVHCRIFAGEQKWKSGY